MNNFGKFLSSTPGILVMLVSSALLGALMFSSIEAPNDVRMQVQASNARQRIFLLAQELAEAGDEADWSQLVEQVDKYRNRLQEAWKAGTDELGLAKEQPSWDFWASLYYCITLFSTIGYGNVFPGTVLGRIATIIYGMISIPLCSIVVSRLSRVIARLLKAIYLMTLESSRIPVGLREAYSRADSSFDFSLLPSIGLLIAYYSLSGLIYCWGISATASDWKPLDAVYFSFISMTSVGLGDVVPSTDAFLNVLSLLYLLLGLALTNLVFLRVAELMEERLQLMAGPSRLSTSSAIVGGARFAEEASRKDTLQPAINNPQ